MASIESVLKEEIRRLARKETKQPTAALKKSSAALRRAMAALKRRVAALESQTKRLMAQAALGQERPERDTADEVTKARIGSKTIRGLRAKFRLSQAQLGKLLGVSSQSIYQWERGERRLNLRRRTKAAVVEIRNLKRNEIGQRLAALAASKRGRTRKPARPVARRARGRKRGPSKRR